MPSQDTSDTPGTQPTPTGNGSEEVLVTTHPVVFRNHLMLTGLFSLLILAGLAGLALWLAGTRVLGMEGTALLVVSLVVLGLAAIYFLYRWLHGIMVTLTVTTKRTILKKGLITRQTNEVQHDDVRNIKCDQNVLERLFNYGDISLSSAGQGDMEIVAYDIPDPQNLIGIIRNRQ